MRISEGSGEMRSAPVRGMVAAVFVGRSRRCRFARGVGEEELREIMSPSPSPSPSPPPPLDGRLRLGCILTMLARLSNIELESHEKIPSFPPTGLQSIPRVASRLLQMGNAESDKEIVLLSSRRQPWLRGAVSS